MIGWKGALVVLAVLAALGFYAYQSRPRGAPPARPALVPCGLLDTVEVRLEGGGRTLRMARGAPDQPWRLVDPDRGEADASGAAHLVTALQAVRILNTLPAGAAGAGLDQPRLTAACRVAGGSSYTLSVGNQSFDGSGYYARKSGDARIHVISSVEVDQLDRALAEPPVKPVPSPTR